MMSPNTYYQNELIYYTKDIFLIEVVELSENDKSKVFGGFIPIEIESINFVDPDNKTIKFLKLAFDEDTINNLIINLKENNLKWIAIDQHIHNKYYDIIGIWKGSIGVLTNLDWMSFLHSFVVTSYPFNYFIKTKNEIIAEKDIEYNFNNEYCYNKINIIYNITKIY